MAQLRWKSVLLSAVFLCLGSQIAAPQAPKTATLAASYAGKAVRLMQDRRFAEAATEFERALAATPADDNVRIQYATCLFAQERNSDARAQFEILRQHRGSWPGLDYYLGLLDYRAGDFPSAIRRLSLLKANPTFPKSSFYLGLAYQGAEQMGPALENLERAAKQNPRDPQVHYRLARLYSMMDRAEEATREYKRYAELNESQRLAEEASGDCINALRTAPPEQARPICDRIAESGETGHLVLLGQLYTQAGAFEYALTPLRRAVELDPRHLTPGTISAPACFLCAVIRRLSPRCRRQLL